MKDRSELSCNIFHAPFTTYGDSLCNMRITKAVNIEFLEKRMKKKKSPVRWTCSCLAERSATHTRLCGRDDVGHLRCSSALVMSFFSVGELQQLSDCARRRTARQESLVVMSGGREAGGKTTTCDWRSRLIDLACVVLAGERWMGEEFCWVIALAR